MRNKKTIDSIEDIFKKDIAKAGGLESLMDQTIEWENTLLRVIQIGPIDVGLDSLESQGLIKKHSNKKCVIDYELTDIGKSSLEQYQNTNRLR